MKIEPIREEVRMKSLNLSRWKRLLMVSMLTVPQLIALHARASDNAAPSPVQNEVATAKVQLNQQIAIITKLEPWVELPELSRLYVLKRASAMTLSLVNQKGLGNMTTIRAYQNLIVTYRFSRDFLTRITNEVNKEQIDQLVALEQQIATARGFDDSPYTQITANVFTQLYQLVQTLSQLPLQDARFKTELQDLVPQLGKVIAIAKEGDRPHTFNAAVPVYDKIKALYPRFDEINRSDAAFNTTLEIMGLNEFYGEFAQAE
jgi:hypothetical protein